MRDYNPDNVIRLPIEQTNIAARHRPNDILIHDDGTYELSVTKHGASRVRFIKNFFNTEQADVLFDRLKNELPWKSRHNSLFNMEEPRLSCWFGEHRYVYWDIEWPAAPFPPVINEIREKLKADVNYDFNSMLGNLYRNSKDTVPWHADNEVMLGKNPFIASVTFGDTRTFEMRRTLHENATEENYAFVQHLKIPLTHGSLLIMEGATQEDWEHQVPTTETECGPRINLTFRTIYPS